MQIDIRIGYNEEMYYSQSSVSRSGGIRGHGVNDEAGGAVNNREIMSRVASS